MKNYKGFNVPESKEEVFEGRSNPMMPTITVSGDDGTVLNVPLSVEEATSLSFDEINEKIMCTIDSFVES